MLLQGKKALILGLANNKSIAYGIANAFKEQGARLAFNYVGDAIKKRVEPLSEELGGEFTFQCDLTDDAQIQAAADLVKEKWGEVDILVHSVAFANREDLSGRFLDTSRAGFHLALDISASSLTGVCRAFEPLLHDGSSVLTMTYHGSTKVIPGYNIMGVAKAALEASVRYLSYDLGEKGVRVNARLRSEEHLYPRGRACSPAPQRDHRRCGRCRRVPGLRALPRRDRRSHLRGQRLQPAGHLKRPSGGCRGGQAFS